jgi:hypothetical protein
MVLIVFFLLPGCPSAPCIHRTRPGPACFQGCVFPTLAGFIIETCSAAVRLVVMVGGHFAVGCARLLHESSPLEDPETHHGANSHIL